MVIAIWSLRCNQQRLYTFDKNKDELFKVASKLNSFVGGDGGWISGFFINKSDNLMYFIPEKLYVSKFPDYSINGEIQVTKCLQG